MNLLNTIKQLPEGSSISIGAASGWFFFGTREEYLERASQIDTEFFDTTKKIFEEAKYQYKTYLPSRKPIYKEYKDHPKKRKVREDKPDEKGIYRFKLEPIPFKEYKQYWEYRYSQARYNYSKWNKYWKNYILMSKRSCLKVYRKYIDEGIGIIVPGCECGNYWLRSEWEADHDNA